MHEQPALRSSALRDEDVRIKENKVMYVIDDKKKLIIRKTVTLKI